MRFAIDWLDHAPNAASEERATACDLRIWVGDVNITEHVVDGRRATIDHVTVSAYPIVEGLAHDWWTILGARDRPYRLTRHRSGYALPEVCLKFDGRYMEITTQQRPYGNPPIRFWAAPETYITRQEAEDALDGLISSTIARLEAKAFDDTGAQLRWRRVNQSREDPDEALFCECAGALGLDPYTIDDAATALIERAGHLFAGEPLIELLAGLRLVNEPERALDWLDRVRQRQPEQFRFTALPEIANDLIQRANACPDERPWALGYRRARELRQVLAMRPEERVGTAIALARRLGADQFAPAERTPGVRALVESAAGSVDIHVAAAEHSPESSKLFALGRALGHYLCFPERRRAVVNDLASAVEQATGRAFAAEFLAPVHEILNLRNDGMHDDEIAGELGVSEKVIEHQIENTDRIVAAFAAAA